MSLWLTLGQTPARKSEVYHVDFIQKHGYFKHSVLETLSIRNNLAIFVSQRQPMKKFMIISTSNDLVRIAPDRIVYISSDGNYSTLMQADGDMRMLSFQLGQIEKMIANQLGADGNIFIRIGKSLIINRSYIYYINVPKQKIVLSDVATVNHTVTASREALKQLKELLEKEGK